MAEVGRRKGIPPGQRTDAPVDIVLLWAEAEILDLAHPLRHGEGQAYPGQAAPARDPP